MLRCRGLRGILLLLLGSLVLKWSQPNFVAPPSGNRGQQGRPLSDSALLALADPEVRGALVGIIELEGIKGQFSQLYWGYDWDS